MENFSEKDLNEQVKRKKINFIDLRINYAFKLIFGTRGNEDMLLLLVQSILPERNITKVELTNTENVGLRPDSRKSVFDIACTTSQGTILNIEMQYRPQEDFNSRMLFYSVFPIYNSVAPGDAEVNTYDTDPICMIGITNFELRRIKKNTNFINSYRLLNTKDSGIEFTDTVSYVTVELPKFKKDLQQLKTDAERLFFTLKHIGTMKRMPAEFAGTPLEKLFRLCSFANMDMRIQMDYIREWMAQVDERSRMRTAQAEAEARGEAKGKTEMAKALKEMGVPADKISKASGLSTELIAAL